MYPPQRAGVRATTIHDLVPLHFPELVHPRTLRMHRAKYRHAAATCDVVFANSRFTAADVAEHLRIPGERIRVAYPGIDARFVPDGERADLGAPYVLTVSTLDPRKNVEVVLEAFKLLRRERPDLLLAVAGGVAPGAPHPPAVRAFACSASSTNSGWRRSTEGLPRSSTRRGSRASGCRSSKRSRAAPRLLPPHTRRLTRRRGRVLPR